LIQIQLKQDEYFFHTTEESKQFRREHEMPRNKQAGLPSPRDCYSHSFIVVICHQLGCAGWRLHLSRLGHAEDCCAMCNLNWISSRSLLFIHEY
jgi:hypothetical protein